MSVREVVVGGEGDEDTPLMWTLGSPRRVFRPREEGENRTGGKHFEDDLSVRTNKGVKTDQDVH